MSHWTDIEQIEIEHAERMLHHHGEVLPTLYAFRYDDLSLLADLRPFERFGAAEALGEVLEVASAMRCNRLVFAGTGRVQSLDAPAPADRAGDERPRAHLLTRVDGVPARPREWTTLRRYELVDGEVQWGETLELGEGEGPVGRALHDALRPRTDVPTSPEGLLALLRRCDERGHDLRIGRSGMARLLPVEDPRRAEILADVDAGVRDDR